MFPRRAAVVALLATAIASVAAWVVDELIGFPAPFDRVVRDTGVIPAYAICLLAALASSKQGRTWLIGRVPITSGVALAVFRIVFAASLTLVVRSIDASFAPICHLLLALFAAGVAAPISFLAFVIVFTRAHLGHTADHDVALPLKTLWLMTIVPWSAGFSVDAAVRRIFGRPALPERSRAYGLATWIPVMMVGLAYAAAAFAKIDEVGPQWITRGAVRYIFLNDGHDRLNTLSRSIIGSDALSALVSGLAVGGESSVVLAAIWPTTFVLCAAGLVALGLQLGFYLFQGLWWTAWWGLLPAFVPWEALVSKVWRGTREPVSLPHRRLVWSAVLLFVAVLQQPVASLLRREYSFALSDFPMYSNVYFASKAEIVAAQERAYQPPPLIRFDVPDSGGRNGTTVNTLNHDQALLDAARKVARGEPLTDADAARVRHAASRYADEFGAVSSPIEVLADTWRFDWSAVDFVPRQQWTPVATISLERGVIEARKP